MNPIVHAILKELTAMPAPYLAPAAPLRNAVRWAVIPQPDYAEIDSTLKALESSGYITKTDSLLHGLRYAITDAGRALLNS